MTILENVLLGIIAALLIALGVVLVVNADLRADLARADANAVTLARVNADMKSAIEKQDSAFAAEKSVEDRQAKKIQQIMKAESAHMERAKSEAAKIASQRLKGSDCEKAKEIFQDYLKATDRPSRFTQQAR